MSAEYVDGGVFGQLRIRTARKAGQCEYGRRVTGGPHCRNEIKPGDKYAEGESDGFKAGGYARARWCMECVASFIREPAIVAVQACRQEDRAMLATQAGVELIAAIARAEGTP